LSARLPSQHPASQHELSGRARDGDVDAQIALAELLDAEGLRDEAANWLSHAAGARHPYANALYGAWQLLGHNVPLDLPRGVERICFAAEMGESAACALLANLHASGLGVEQSWHRSLDWLTSAAKLGNARALTQLGLLQPGSPLDGMKVALLWGAASRNFDPAQHLLGKALLGAADGQHRATGVAWLQLARRAGNPCAMPQFADDDVAAGLRGPVSIDGLPWQKIRERIDIGRCLAAPANAQALQARPLIQSSQALIPPEFCDYLVGLAAPLMRRAEVNERSQGRQAHDMRTNSAMNFGPTNSDVVLQLINHRVALATREPVRHQENTAVLRYRPGEAYENHFDFIDPAVPAFQEELEQRGQRVATLLIYLNDSFEGGETAFPELAWKYRGSAGHALWWRNVRADGTPDPRTLHAGRPPTRGDKWLLSKWIRNKPQPAGPPN